MSTPVSNCCHIKTFIVTEEDFIALKAYRLNKEKEFNSVLNFYCRKYDVYFPKEIKDIICIKYKACTINRDINFFLKEKQYWTL